MARRPAALQILGCWLYSIHYMQSAYSYFRFRLDEPEHRRRRGEFVCNYEQSILLPEINNPENLHLLRDKVGFWRRCEAADIAAAPIVAVIDSERVEWTIENGGGFPPCDLFLKEAEGSHSHGTELIRHLGNGCYRTSAGEVVKRERMEARLKKFADGKRYVVQPRLKNHKELERFSLESLCVIRIATIYPSRGTEPVALAASLSMPRGLSTVANFSDGYTASIDVETGVLGDVITRELDFVGDYHPDTGKRVSGAVLPYWEEAIRLCLKGHQEFRSLPGIGWDVIISPEGPVILEGNGIWGCESLQMPHNQPMTDTPYVDLFLQELEWAQKFFSQSDND